MCQPIKAHQWILNTNGQISDYLCLHHTSAMFVLPLVSFSISKYKVTADLQKHRGHWINEYLTETGNKQTKTETWLLRQQKSWCHQTVGKQSEISNGTENRGSVGFGGF